MQTMTNAVPPASPDGLGEVSPRPRKSRGWIWVVVWIAGFLAIPGFLAGVLYQQRSREIAESLVKVSASPSPVAPAWVPLFPDLRIQQASSNGSSGNVTLLAAQTVEELAPALEDRFRKEGFAVSSNLMRRDDAISTAILNASNPAAGQFALVTLSKARFGARIEIAFSERK